MTIRDATAADMEAVATIYADAVLNGTASFELEPPAVGEMRQRWERVVEAAMPWLVLERAGRIAGYAYAGAYRPRPAYRFAVEDSIYVDPACHGQGVGRALLEALVARCTDLGMRRMVAVIGDSRSTGSIALHASCGFIAAGIVPCVGWKHGRWLDQVLMQRPLGAGDATPPSR
ncbi:N-acetyltransferase family protein [Alsobacter sp. R-9]